MASKNPPLGTTPTAVVQYIVELPEFKTRDKRDNGFFKNNSFFRKILQDGLCHGWNVQYGSLNKHLAEQVDANVVFMAQHFPIWYKTYAHGSVRFFTSYNEFTLNSLIMWVPI